MDRQSHFKWELTRDELNDIRDALSHYADYLGKRAEQARKRAENGEKTGLTESEYLEWQHKHIELRKQIDRMKQRRMYW